VERGEPDGPLIGAWEAVRRLGDSGGGGSHWRVGNGGGDECGEEVRAPHPFIGSVGKRGGWTGKEIRRPMVVASMPAVRFSGEGKRRGDWGVKRGESVLLFPREEGSSGWQRRPVELPEEEDSRAADRGAHLLVRGSQRGQAGPEGGGREAGRGWAANRKWPD
jgi:hypothetical protein